jgi:hypothetical protein
MSQESFDHWDSPAGRQVEWPSSSSSSSESPHPPVVSKFLERRASRSDDELFEYPQPTRMARGPRIFIINCHGVTFPDTDGSPAMINDVLVDTFTSAKFARGFGKFLYNPTTCSFFDEPYEYFIDRILETTKSSPRSFGKDDLREKIMQSLCHVRDVTGVIVKDSCRFRCHHKGRRMADMYILSSGPVLDDTILCVDLFRRTVEDVHDKFGLRQVVDRPIAYPSGRKQISRDYTFAISKSERELDDLRQRIVDLSQPHLNTPENRASLDELRKKYDKKHSKLNMTLETLRGAMQGPKYRYSDEHEPQYDVLDVPKGKVYMIKLSDAISIAIRNRTINPDTDFVLVEACRNFYGQLPSGYNPENSPGRTGSEPDSSGGSHTNYKYSRKKMVKNKNKYNNKRKTIRNKKLSKSYKLRNSRKSRKRSNF